MLTISIIILRSRNGASAQYSRVTLLDIMLVEWTAALANCEAVPVGL
jgi:hypothetical protein